MTTRGNPDWGNKPLIVIIGLIASLIGIFVFITGKQSIQEIVGVTPSPVFTEYSRSTPTPLVDLTPTSTRRPTATPIPTPIPTDTPTPTSTPTRTPTQAPTAPPQVLDSGNPGVSIVLRDGPQGSDGKLIVHLVTPSGFPLRNLDWWLCPAVQEVGGEWNIDDTGDCVEVPPDRDGSYDPIGLVPGDYGLEEFGGQLIEGEWGNARALDGEAFVVFPIHAGKTTETTITLSVFEIGLLREDGRANDDQPVEGVCQAYDVAGNRIEGAGWFRGETDPRGIATFFAGSNCTYMLWADHYTHYWLEWDVTIEPGEVQRRVYQYPYAGIKR